MLNCLGQFLVSVEDLNSWVCIFQENKLNLIENDFAEVEED